MTVFVMALITFMPNHIKADDTNTDDADTQTVLVSDEIGIKGFQIRSNRYGTAAEIAEDEEKFGVSFRVVGTAPQIGQNITVNGLSYKVKKVGVIYVLDTNKKGYNGTNEYEDEKFTLIDINSYSIDEKTGAKIYKGINTTDRTYGYESTEIGLMNSDTPDTVVFCRTMTKMENYIANTIHTRTFVVAEDEAGKEVIIYGKNIKSLSVAELANYLYVNNACTNVYAHQFLYNKILNGKNGDESAESVLEQADNPYYRNAEIPYGWNGSIFTPEESEE